MEENTASKCRRKPGIGLLDDECLAQVKNQHERNLADEALQLISQELTTN